MITNVLPGFYDPPCISPSLNSLITDLVTLSVSSNCWSHLNVINYLKIVYWKFCLKASFAYCIHCRTVFRKRKTTNSWQYLCQLLTHFHRFWAMNLP